MKKITITFDDKANFTVATEGFKGKACKQATEQFEREIGIVKSDTATADMYKTEVAQQQKIGGK